MNFLAILLAAIAGMVVGFIWYGPLFGKAWIKLSNFTKKDMEKAKKKGMGKTYLAAFLSMIVMSAVVEFLLSEIGAMGPGAGALIGFLFWLGLYIPVSLSQILWMGKSKKLWLIDAGHYLVAFVVMSIILATW